MVSKKFSRVLSGIMAFLMILSMFPVNVFAAEENAEETAQTLDVTVSVVTADSDKKAIENASVSIKGGSIVKTDENGVANITGLTEGTKYEVTVSCDGYASETQEVVFTADSLSKTFELYALKDVEFVVKVGEDAVADATITVEGVEKPVTTGSDGTAVVKELAAGKKYAFKVECVGYVPYEKDFVCSDELVEVSLEKSKHDIVLTVVEGENPVSGAVVKIAKDVEGTFEEIGQGISDENGQVTFSKLTYGDKYTATVECKGFVPYEETFACDQNAIDEGVRFDLTRKKLDLVLTVKDKEQKPVAGAKVSVKEAEVGTTDADGKLILTDLVYGTNYTASVKCEGYFPNSVVFTCNDDAAPTVVLEPYTKTTVSGVVTCDGEPVKNAIVTLKLTEGENKSSNTDAEGKFSFVDVYQELVAGIMVEGGDPYETEDVTKDKVKFAEDNNIVLDKKTYTIKTEAINAYDGDTQVAWVTASKSKVKHGESVEISIKTVEKQRGRSTHSIYQIIDNDAVVHEEASGATEYVFTIDNIKENHTVSVRFSRDLEEITFWVDADGKVYVRDEESDKLKQEKEPWRLGKLNVGTNQILNEETGEEEAGVKVSYSPAKNYRISSVEVDGQKVTAPEGDPNPYEENDNSYEETDFTALEKDKKRQYVIQVEPNRFTVKLDANVTEAVRKTIQMDPTDGVVNYDRSLTMTITPPEDQYLSVLTVNGEDVLDSVSYSDDDEDPTYVLKNIREDKTVVAGFAAIENEEDTFDKLIKVISSQTVYKKPQDNTDDNEDTYYLARGGKITIQAADHARISRFSRNKFKDCIEIAGKDTINVLYLRKGWHITSVEHTIKTIVDTTAPEITKAEQLETVEGGKVTAVTWKITAADNENGSGINKVVYSNKKSLKDSAIRDLTTEATLDENGLYCATFKNVRDTYYFWAIDNLGHISEISKDCYVDSDTEAPVINSFTATGFRSFTLQEGDNAVTKHYPKEEGVTFTAEVTDELSMISSVTLKIGDRFSKAMTVPEGSAKYQVTVTPAEYNNNLESSEKEELAVTVIAQDDSRNTNENAPYSLDQKLIFEEKVPEVSVEITKAVKVDGVNWYDKEEGNPTNEDPSANVDVLLTITVKDSGAGLNTEQIKLWNNNAEIFPVIKARTAQTATCSVVYTDENENTLFYAPEKAKITQAVFTICAEGVKNDLTHFDFKISVKDNEGNQTEVASKDNEALKFSIDDTKPEIKKFDLVPNSEDSAEESNSGAYDDKQEPSYEELDTSDVVATDYGYFFRRAAKVTVYAKDTGSQMKTITFGKKNISAEGVTFVTAYRKNEAPAGTTNYPVLEYDENIDRWWAEFDVEEGFKGQIYTYAVDNVDNSNQAEQDEQNFHPEDLTITESQVSHNAYNADDKTRHVVLTLPEAKVKDKAGTPLYTLNAKDEEGNAVNENGVPVTMTIRDTYNGIKTVNYKVTVPGTDPKEIKFDIRNVKVETDNDGKQYFADKSGQNWYITAKDQNLITEITTDLYVKDNRNGIEVTASMTDMADNASSNMSPYGDKAAKPLKLSIDNDAPVITFAHMDRDTNLQAHEPTEGTAKTSLGTSPYFVGFDPSSLTNGYPIYSASTLQYKVVERNFIHGSMSALTEADKALLSDLMTADAKKVMVNKNLQSNATDADIYTALVGQLKFFGPFYDDTRGTPDTSDDVRTAADYPYVDVNGKYYGDSVYYLVELRDCVEEAASGTYETSLKIVDLVGNEAAAEENFIIDDTAPQITITFDNNSVRNGKYYNAARVATISVVERNFNNETSVMNGAASNAGTTVTFPALSSWTESADYTTHTATVQFTEDALYEKFGITYTDLAGLSNKLAVSEFYIDQTMPVLNISGVQDKSANNGTVAPVITYTDLNLDAKNVKITLTGVNNGAVEFDAIKEATENGEKYSYYDFDHKKNVDDVYTLFVQVIDLAGNTVTDTIRFSCNRFGSVFDLSKIVDMLGKYNQKERTIVVTETNVDKLDMDKVRVTLTKNGNPVDLMRGRDFTVEMVGEDGTWHQYTYQIHSSLFKDDGTYSLYFYTEDVAGNINENIDETKEAQISFGIDKTKPIATPIDFESDVQYAMETKRVYIDIKDNLLLENVNIYLNGQKVTYAVTGDTYAFDIPMSNSRQTVRIVAVDAAGNEEEIFVKDFLVTTNLLVRWINNTPLFIGSMVAIALLLILLFWRIIVFILRQRDDEEVI